MTTTTMATMVTKTMKKMMTMMIRRMTAVYKSNDKVIISFISLSLSPDISLVSGGDEVG